jgi:formylglycine-generating enzyme
VKRLVPVLAVLIASACSLADRPTAPPEGQIVLYMTTDTILRAPPSEPNGAPGLFDRLSIEIFPPGESTPCAGCARQFSIDSQAVDEGRVSMGYIPKPGVPGSRARLRLFRTLGAEIVEARATSTLEMVIALPVTEAEGIIEVTAVLETASLGAPVGTLDAPAAPRLGPPPRGLVGTWEAARRRSTCTGEAQPGEVCIPGGAFWIGRPRVALPFPDSTKYGLERLVAVSPFFLDTTEATVKSYRDSQVYDDQGPGRFTVDAECNFSDRVGPREMYPVNCVAKAQAELYCKMKGGRLPTEAEYELVATAFGRFVNYPWGEDPPRCGDAIYGRAIGATSLSSSKECAPATGTAPVGTALRDRLAVPGGEIVDLAGNVTEWVADDYEQETEPCWAPPILLDPRCVTTLGVPLVGGRGAWYGVDRNTVDVKTRFRFPGDPNGLPRSIGVRCARTSE